MKLDKVISQISAIIAECIVFVFACGMYLQFKGFAFLENGEIVLIKEANAKSTDNTISADIILPKGHSVGSPSAPSKMYVFSSYGCFACAKFHNSVIPQVIKEFVDTNKLEIVFVDFPLESASMQASVLGNCMAKDKYLSYANEVFKTQPRWIRAKDVQEKLISYAVSNGMSKEDAQKCLSNKENAQKILNARQEAMANLRIMATPSILIINDGQRTMHEGSLTFLQISKILNKN